MTEQIEKRIAELEAEAAALQVNHDNVVKQFQQIVTQNQTRFAQIKGAIGELTALKAEENNGESDPVHDAESRIKKPTKKQYAERIT